MRSIILSGALALALAACTTAPETGPTQAQTAQVCEVTFEKVIEAVNPGSEGLLVYEGQEVERWLFYYNNWPPVGESYWADRIMPVVTQPGIVTAMLFVNGCLDNEVDVAMDLALLLHECTKPVNEAQCNRELDAALKQSRGPNVSY